MRKKYLEPRMMVQEYDEEAITSELEDDGNMGSTIYDGDGETGSDDDFFFP